MTLVNDPGRPAQAGGAGPAGVERPAAAGGNAPKFGSDVVADMLRSLDIPWIALNPGASYRGLHDSLVNHLGNAAPQMLLCLHEESAVAIAHGYAKVTGRAMAVAVHSNVGLMHATMGLFNAWCDRMPMLVLGATGPVDAAKRRPWIDWIHTARDQGALVRHYTKWDDQPASPTAARESLLRAWWLANSAPQAPTYVVLDVELQEAELPAPLPPIDAARFMPPLVAGPPADLVARAAALLLRAERPLILAGRVSRDLDAWTRRIALAEALQARVATNLKAAAAFPTDHPLHPWPAATFPGEALTTAMREADVILSLDWIDLAGTLKALGAPPAAKIVQVSLDHQLHNGWSMDHQGLPPVDLFIAADPDATVAALLAALDDGRQPAPAMTDPTPVDAAPAVQPEGPIAVEHLARSLRAALGDRPAALAHTTISWQGQWWPFRHPLDFLGSDGGGGLGAGPGLAVGAALALAGSDRMTVAVCGDGDFLMGVTAIWTAVHYRLPLLIVIANNRSFYNDEVHQERVARMRGRPVENKWIGQRMDDPDIDLAAMARAQGAQGFGPVTRGDALAATLATAVAAVEAGAVAVVDVRVEPGYGAVAAALTRAP
ncbi:MAG: thiamine pyrophosphate-binding protein [Rhodoplanes sp.]|uniref:thiamine pyrophosphate-binding protein n=1 Tax=Rhodoplanes sp. TaxID=1968906 RepID=UPI001842FC97|nr:thiamine pyrophosphate-dependent enzyme [Rhodoplanes sp.]NVO17539.1 thiamine pyrophosphate-binding protein [Rhodoplanes sp.]